MIISGETNEVYGGRLEYRIILDDEREAFYEIICGIKK